MDAATYGRRELPLIPFPQLKGKTFVIPYQQRGYKWTSSNMEAYVRDMEQKLDFYYAKD